MSLVLHEVPVLNEAAESGFGAYVWSDTYGAWQCLYYSPDHAKVALLVEHLALAQCLLVPPLIVDLPKLDRQSRIAMGLGIASPVGAEFIDPAPDGIIQPVTLFHELVAAVALEAQFSTWRSEAFWQSEGEVTVDDALRLLFLDRADALDRWLGPDPVGYLARG